MATEILLLTYQSFTTTNSLLQPLLERYPFNLKSDLKFLDYRYIQCSRTYFSCGKGVYYPESVRDPRTVERKSGEQQSPKIHRYFSS